MRHLRRRLKGLRGDLLLERHALNDPRPVAQEQELQAPLVRLAVQPALDRDLLPDVVGEVAYVNVLSHVYPSRVVFRGRHMIVGVWAPAVNVAHTARV